MKTNKIKKINPDNHPFTITHSGSLGLLAHGDIGIRAWRKVKLRFLKETNK